MAPKPTLPPLMTPMAFPSELRGPSSAIYLDPKPRQTDPENKENTATTTITPPPAYTEFLQTFSPIFASPRTSRVSFAKYMLDRPRASPTSASFTSTSTSFAKGARPLSPLSPVVSWSVKDGPAPPRRLRIPPPYIYSPSVSSDTPRSAHLRSSCLPPPAPADWGLRCYESPISEGEGGGEGESTVCVRHVVVTTVTYKRAPRLDPPPPGKRRRSDR